MKLSLNWIKDYVKLPELRRKVTFFNIIDNVMIIYVKVQG